MKKSLLILIALLITPFAVKAQDGIGIGGMIGSPNGVTVRTMIDEGMAFQGAASFNLTENFSSLYLHGDLVWSLYDDTFVDIEAGTITPYAGTGIRLNFIDDFENTIGIRFPVGLNYNYKNWMDLFIESVPFVDIQPDVRISFTGGVGFRFYLSNPPNSN